ncbi:MAG: hypothetical protein ABDH28_00795 [Brevinematia bacterium]
MILWSIIGIIIGLIIFLLLMNLRSYGGNDRSSRKREAHNEENEDKNYATKPRHCPVCGSKLGPRDVIYAEIFQAEPRDKVVIKGCKYCYILTPEEAMKIRPYTKRIRQNDIGVGKYL